MNTRSRVIIGATMAVAAVATAVVGVTGVQPAAQAAGCPSYKFFGVKGSGEGSTAEGYGIVVNAVRESLAKKVSGGEATAIDYPAIPVSLNLSYKKDYSVSVNEGINVLQSKAASFHTRCPATPIVFAGYSQGAQVAGDVYQSISQGVRDKTTLVMLGDSRFNPGQSDINAGNFNKDRHGIWAAWFAGWSHTLRSFKPSEYGSVRSYCVVYDPICNYTAGNFFNCIPFPGWYCIHSKYLEFGYPDDAATWIQSRLPQAQSSPAGAKSYAYRVTGTGGVGVKVRSGPTTASAKLSTVAEGGTINIVCQAHGQRVLAQSDIWDRLTNGGWVYDWYTTTPVTGGFSPPIPQC
jgi:hypothetical protein